MPSLSHAARIAALSMLCALVGCGSEAIGTVSGTVTRAGKPVPDLAVVFVPEQGRPSRGLTDGDGRYELLYMPGQPGARVGKHRVTVQLRLVSPKDEKPLRERIARMRNDDALQKSLEKYGDESRRPFEFDVAPGAQVIDIKLD
jgi:hypothetical protein